MNEINKIKKEIKKYRDDLVNYINKYSTQPILKLVPELKNINMLYDLDTDTLLSLSLKISVAIDKIVLCKKYTYTSEIQISELRLY